MNAGEIESYSGHMCTEMSRLTPNWFRLAPNGKKSRTLLKSVSVHFIYFLRLVSIHFGSLSQNVLKLILKSPRFVPFGANLAQFVNNPDIRAHVAHSQVRSMIDPVIVRTIAIRDDQHLLRTDRLSPAAISVGPMFTHLMQSL